jgi:hypothetical protein
MQGNGTTLSAREILRREYGDSRNFLTPHVLAVGKLNRETAYELSAGEGIEPGTKLYGVSVVRVVDGATARDYDAATCFSSLADANAYVEGLRTDASSALESSGTTARNEGPTSRAGSRANTEASSPSRGSTAMTENGRYGAAVCKRCGSSMNPVCGAVQLPAEGAEGRLDRNRARAHARARLARCVGSGSARETGRFRCLRKGG